MIGQVLSALRLPQVAEGEEQITVAGKRDAAADLVGLIAGRALEDDPLVGQRLRFLVVAGAHHPHGRCLGAALQIGKIDKAVGGELRIDRHIKEAAVELVEHGRNAGHLFVVGAGPGMLKMTRPLRYKKRSIRQRAE